MKGLDSEEIGQSGPTPATWGKDTTSVRKQVPGNLFTLLLRHSRLIIGLLFCPVCSNYTQ